MEEQEDKRGFRVQDRRRFSPETGEPRSVEDDPQKAETANTKEQETPPHSDQPRASRSSSSGEQLSFSSFILGLSTQALMYMGEIPPAPGQPVQTDLSAAQQMIDVLAMLQQKTTGNLDTGESSMLEHALFDLRMRYVELAKKA